MSRGRVIIESSALPSIILHGILQHRLDASMNDIVVRWRKSSRYRCCGTCPFIWQIIMTIKKAAKVLKLSPTRSFTCLNFRHVEVNYGCSTFIVHHQILRTNIVMTNTGLVYFRHSRLECLPDRSSASISMQEHVLAYFCSSVKLTSHCSL